MWEEGERTTTECTASHRHLRKLHYHRYYTRAAMDLVFIMPIYKIPFFFIRFYENSHMNINIVAKCFRFSCTFIFVLRFEGLPLFSIIRIYDCVLACVHACGFLLYACVTVTLGGARLCWCWLWYLCWFYSYLNCHCDFSDQVIKSNEITFVQYWQKKNERNKRRIHHK